MIKYLIISLSILISTNLKAENIIYKCTDKDGNLTYTNKKEDSKCKKTDLATIDKGLILNKEPSNLNSQQSPSELIVPGLTTPKTPPTKLPNSISIEPGVDLILSPHRNINNSNQETEKGK